MLETVDWYLLPIAWVTGIITGMWLIKLRKCET